MAGSFPSGVRLIPLDSHADERGIFTEIYREEWLARIGLNGSMVQWNMVSSKPNVLRGVHVHRKHDDYLLVAQGRTFFGLHDLRPSSDTFGLTSQIELNASALQVLVIPRGVAHGFYFLEQSLHIYAVSRYWDLEDEQGCRFDDPSLNIRWPTKTPLISARDLSLPGIDQLTTFVRDL